MTAPCAARERNAVTTERAILDTARSQFAACSYDEVGLRDIVAQAGVDAAVAHRYFGSKEATRDTTAGRPPDTARYVGRAGVRLASPA